MRGIAMAIIGATMMMLLMDDGFVRAAKEADVKGREAVGFLLGWFVATLIVIAGGW